MPALTSHDDRVVALRRVLAAETEPMVSLTQLLRLCRDEHATLWEHHADPRCRARVAGVVGRAGDALPAPDAERVLSPHARRALAEALTAGRDIPPVVLAHALAELLDERYGHVFTDWFRLRSPYQPAVGDPVPLDRPDWRRVTTLAPTAPPWRLANRLDETRRVRLAGGWTTQFRVVFDYSAFDTLAGMIADDTVIATCHPNRHLGELSLPSEPGRPAFPVGPRDPRGQRRCIDQLLATAAVAGAQVVVLPELSVNEAVAADLAAWVRRPGPLRLLVAGSYHYADPADPGQRANRAIAWVRGHPHPLIHDKHSPADQPVTEDITPTGWPELRVYVTADGWHLVIAVCRDLLNPQAVHALTEAGANLVLAPAMSETLLAFGGPVAQLVGSGQALVAVANNPADWSDPDRPDRLRQPSRALFGHPGFAQQSRQVTAPDHRPGVAALSVGAGRLSWHPIEDPATEHARRPEPSAGRPPWIAELARRSTTGARRHLGATVTLRPAAVLVVVTDGVDGPEVLLTTRAPDLTNYASQLTFPGGAADPADLGPVDTALREASEEIGLHPGSVQIIGTLPSFALADTGFLVTPVLAWSREPRFVHPPNPGEVTAVERVAISASGAPPATDSAGAAGARVGTIGAMTTAVLELVAARLAVTQGIGRDPRGQTPAEEASQPTSTRQMLTGERLVTGAGELTTGGAA